MISTYGFLGSRIRLGALKTAVVERSYILHRNGFERPRINIGHEQRVQPIDESSQSNRSHG